MLFCDVSVFFTMYLGWASLFLLGIFNLFLVAYQKKKMHSDDKHFIGT